jgi:hypothetical protein
MYNLHRNHTLAPVEEAAASKDGKWVAMGSRKHTIYVFVVNPYGERRITRVIGWEGQECI